MRFDLRAEEWEMVDALAINPLKKAGAAVYIFGSRARGSNHKFSDLDILYDSSTDISLSLISEIKWALEQSSLVIKVDLVNAKEIANSYKAQILNERVLV